VTILSRLKTLFPSPLRVFAQEDWSNLTKAHHLARHLQFDEAMPIYQAVLDNDIRRYFYEPIPGLGWGLSSDQTVPSLNGACVLLREYFTKAKIWTTWNRLAEIVFRHPDYQGLSDPCKSRMISTQGWANMSTKQHHLQRTIEAQIQALGTLQIHDFEAALHHLILGIAYRKLNRKKQSLKHAHAAVNLLSFAEEPFYFVRARANLAAAYYYSEEYGTAIKLYEETNKLIAPLGKTVETELLYYDLAWAYAEDRQFQLALENFEKAYELAQANALEYDRALILYGFGFTFLLLEDFPRAEEMLKRALAYFFDGDPRYNLANRPRSALMASACSHLLAAVYEQTGEYDKGLEKALDALQWHEDIDDPVEYYYVIRRLFRLYLKSHRWLSAARYLIKYWSMKIRLGK